ncbi:aldehyde dehydrogenase [Arthrobacter sp. HMSC06H05]|uniref:Aldehyde dehydrogenase n=1 Tax=Pseudoglutamicibacter albus DNF00011 TaxID=1401063 RepID=A0A096AGD9_9MICC|nr:MULTISPECIES: aldehyde dehydrogenase family protein [Micrococcaceae]KGF20014.1 aldehyde dehydrogenase [Pseudoglutamicibacter albus DNF00011]OFT41049.1 aldehyde dehydrogenase [Arthrobacter sp. HMSC06H05]
MTTENVTYATVEELRAAFDLPSEGREIKDPATGELVGYAPEPTVEDLDRAVVKAREAQKSWAAKSFEERANVMMAVADALDENAEQLAQLLSREQGKPLNGPNARFEVGACSAWLRATAAIEVKPEVLFDDESGKAELHWRPLGVVGAVGPWNWPMMITMWQIAPNLKMGNATVIKPSEYTPLSVLAMVSVMNRVLPEGLVQVIAGGRDVGEAFTAHKDIDKIMFTGSIETGKAIAKASAETLKRVTLELGGNDAGIVLDDVDPAAIAEDLFWGAFINTGQTCAALKRLYVPDSIYDEVVEELRKVAEAMPMGVGLGEENVLGPLQNQMQLDVVKRLVQAAKDGGARIVTGGEERPADEAGFFYPATLVADIDNDNPLVAEEQFGPALPIIRYTDVEEAIEMANGLEVGLGSSVWSSNRERALEVANRLEAGTTWINKHGAIDPRMPFGGAKQSGYGVEFALEGLKEVAQPHVINY